MNTLFIIRGLPGSGKSTEAKRLRELNPDRTLHYEADDYFTNAVTNEYIFDPAMLSAAHQECFRSVEHGLKCGFDVIVSNTFSTKWELEKYINLAKNLGVNIDIRQMNNSFKSIHNVPEVTIQKMKRRWESYPGCVEISS